MFSTVLKFSKILLVSSLVTLSFASLSIEVAAYAQCTNNLKAELNNELDRLNSISDGKSNKQKDDELKLKIKQKNKISYGEFNNYVIELKPIALKTLSGSYTVPSESTLEFKDFKFDSDNTLSGVLIEHRIYNYLDQTNGYSKNDYNLVYNNTTKKLSLTLINDYILNKEKPTESTLSKEEINNLITKKDINKVKNEATKTTKQNDAKEAITDRSSRYENKKIELRKQIKEANCTINAKAGTGIYYDRYAVKDYARNNYDSYNPGYNNYTYSGGDCTNFGSQAVYNGKLIQDGGWYTWDSAWYSGKNSFGQYDSFSVSKTWREVNAFKNHMYYNENTGNLLDFDSQGYAIFDPLLTGDLVFFDFDRDGSYDHTTIITGWNLINGHWEPKLTYHTINRLDKPFAEVKGSAKVVGLEIFGEVW